MQAHSSVAEHCHYMTEVGGSIPSAPTISARQARHGRPGRIAVLVALAAGLAACSSLPSATDAAPAKATAGEYVLGAGDRISVFVYDSPQLSVSLPFRPDGRISLPLVPEIAAAGKTPSQLAADISRRLKEYIKD